MRGLRTSDGGNLGMGAWVVVVVVGCGDNRAAGGAISSDLGEGTGIAGGGAIIVVGGGGTTGSPLSSALSSLSIRERRANKPEERLYGARDQRKLSPHPSWRSLCLSLKVNSVTSLSLKVKQS
jgi:hypothetical protein